MTTNNEIASKTTLFKAYGYVAILISAYYLQSYAYDLIVLHDSLYSIYPFIIFSSLILLSGIGIVTRNTHLFITTIYAYMFLAVYCLFDLYSWQGAEIIGQFQYQRMKQIIAVDLILFFVAILIIIYSLRLGTLVYFRIMGRAKPIKHLVASFIVSALLLVLWNNDHYY